MRTDVAAAAVGTYDGGSSTENDCCVLMPPDPPRRRRWWRLRPGTGFLDRPGGAEYANRWQSSCGQGG